MKLQLVLSATALAFTAFAGNPVFAQMNYGPRKNGHGGNGPQHDRRRSPQDRQGSAGKITIKHGEIKHMEMPGMTMVFVVKDKALLDKTSVGAKIQFMATNENGQMTVTDIQPVK
jgi:Cu(I)/Ag(I) efflux system protein CusF